VKRRSTAELVDLERRLGRDLRLDFAGPSGAWQDGDLGVGATVQGARRHIDLAVIGGIEEAATQLLVNRLQARRGELAPLGHPNYGSRHHELIGEPNTERTRNLVKLHVLDCLRHEPRIAKIERCEVTAGDRPRDIVRITLQVRLIDRPEPLNLVVPFELGGGP
jgi:phage baseplate assembly protein W